MKLLSKSVEVSVSNILGISFNKLLIPVEFLVLIKKILVFNSSSKLLISIVMPLLSITSHILITRYNGIPKSLTWVNKSRLCLRFSISETTRAASGEILFFSSRILDTTSSSAENELTLYVPGKSITLAK